MKLVHFKAENLFSFERINFSLANAGLVLVNGWNNDDSTCNGSGKSSLTTKGIIWTLYGKTLSGIRGDEVIRKGQSSCVGEITFLTNNIYYIIRRSRGPNKLSLFDLKSNKDISCKTQVDTQELIDRLLGKDYQTFIYTDYFGQGYINSFMSLSLSQQNILLESVIPLEQISSWITSAKAYNKELTSTHEKTKAWYSTLHGQLSEARKNNREQHEKDQVYKLEVEELKKEIENISLETLEVKYKTLEDNIQKGRNQQQQVSNTKNKLSIEKEALILKKKTLKQNICPTCNQAINTYLYDKLLEEQVSIANKIITIDDNLKVLNETYSKWTDFIDKNKKELDPIASQITATKLSISKIEMIETLLAKQTDWHKRELELLQEQDKVEKDLASLAEQQKIGEFWEGAFKIDFKCFIFERVCPFLEQQTRKHLQGMGQNQIIVKFSTIKELKSGEQKISFNIAVENKTGGDGFDSFSGGEQQLVSFAIGLAFADLVNKTTYANSNILILDEPFVCLDDTNSEKLITYIRETLTNQKETILLISNENSIKDLVANKVNIVKSNGVSQIV